MVSIGDGIDINTRQGYLAIKQNQGGLLALINLQTHNDINHFITQETPPALALTQKFVDERARWLLRDSLQ